MGNSAARAETILQELLRNGEVSVETLMRQLGVDASTIRRDLEKLERRNLLRRVHGGAVRVEALSYTAYAHNLSFHGNMGKQIESKTRIAQAAARLIQPGDTVAFSPGTTVTLLAQAIRQRQTQPLTVVTNAANIAMELAAAPGVSVVLTGGALLPDFFALVGPLAEQNLGELFTQIAFVGMHGVSADQGLMGPNQLEGLAYRTMMRRARRVVVLADHTKIGQTALYRIAPITAMHTLITNHEAPRESLAPIEAAGCEVICV